MTLDEWAIAVDDAIAARGVDLRDHARADERAVEALRACGVMHFAPGDPLWTSARGSVGARVAEDDATLRAVFIPAQSGAIAERTYVRSDVGARDAAAAIASFVGGVEPPG